MYQTSEISHIIASKVLGQTLSPEDEGVLDAWLNVSESNKVLFERIKSLKTTAQIIELERRNYGGRMATRFRLAKSHKTITLRRYYLRFGSIAAAILLLITTSLYILFGDRQAESPITIVPGKLEAVLTLSDGNKIDIVPSAETGKQFVDLKDIGIFTGIYSVSNELQYHKLWSPAGGEFCLLLADHTKVWLNSETELHFPADFSGNERRVYLTKGEAFFEVTEDKEKPFIVSLPEGDITVFGTRFNITHYDESPLSVVLVAGSIGFTLPDGKSTTLQPSEKLVYEAANSDVSVEKTDTALYTAWTEHLFVFEGQTLKEIMTTLSRWYNFSFTFDSEDIQSIRLSGRLYRHQDLWILLKSYEETAEIKFEINGNNIIIQKK
jgi:ferric-dicitrate binding protein FerR (iron transport regulator)